MISGRKSGEVVRAFFAVALPDEARAACAALVRELRSRRDGDTVRWVRPESYHLTLRFLGNVEREAIPELTKRASDEVSGLAAFAVRLGAASIFPSPRSPRVVAVAAEPEAPLAELARRLEAAVEAVGLAPERRGFRAHLTLGRVRSRRFPPLDAGSVTGAAEIPVREVTLYQSEQRREGAVYTALDRISLAGADSGEREDSP